MRSSVRSKRTRPISGHQLMLYYLGVGKTMDASMEELKKDLDSKWSLIGLSRKDAVAEKVLEMVDKKTFMRGREGPKTRIDPLPLNPPTYN